MSQRRRPAKKRSSVPSRRTPGGARQTVIKHPSLPHDYAAVLSDLKQLIAVARRRALATVNRELVSLYWHMGRTIVQRQQQAAWGDGVVEKATAAALLPDASPGRKLGTACPEKPSGSRRRPGPSDSAPPIGKC